MNKLTQIIKITTGDVDIKLANKKSLEVFKVFYASFFLTIVGDENAK